MPWILKRPSFGSSSSTAAEKDLDIVVVVERADEPAAIEVDAAAALLCVFSSILCIISLYLYDFSTMIVTTKRDNYRQGDAFRFFTEN